MTNNYLKGFAAFFDTLMEAIFWRSLLCLIVAIFMALIVGPIVSNIIYGQPDYNFSIGLASCSYVGLFFYITTRVQKKKSS